MKKILNKIMTKWTFLRQMSKYQTLLFIGVFGTIGTVTLILTHAQSYTVQFAVFCSTDSCNNNDLNRLNTAANDVQAWYQQQVGKTFQLAPTRTIQGSHNTAWYLTNNITTGNGDIVDCTHQSGNEALLCYSFANILGEYVKQHPGEIDDFVMGWGVNSSYCGLGGPIYSGAGPDQFSFNMGMDHDFSMGLVDTTGGGGVCNSNQAFEVDLAHELGHAFGLNHVNIQQNSLMGVYGCGYASLQNCGLERTNPNQPNYLAGGVPTSTGLSGSNWFNTTSANPTNPCSTSCPPPPSPTHNANQLVDVISTPTHDGTWTVTGTGKVTAKGTAALYGDASSLNITNIVGMASTPTGKGYWLVASDGGVFSYGDALFQGSMGGKPLNKPIVGMAAAPGGGYWLVASDGGIFSFGAKYYGSTGGTTLVAPIVGMTPVPSGGGYWLVASDGGVFSFGTAKFYGSAGSIKLNQPVVGMASTPDGKGYWLVATDGGIFTYGDAHFYGSLALQNVQVAGMSVIGSGSGTGYSLSTFDGTSYNFPGATPSALGAPVYTVGNGGGGSSSSDHLTIKVAGFPSTASSVVLTSQNHTLGDCPNNTVIPSPITIPLSGGQGSITCNGNTFGHTSTVSTSGTQIIANPPAGYSVSWSVVSGSVGNTSKQSAGNCASVPANAICVNMPANNSSATIQATFTTSAVATLNIGVSGYTGSAPMKSQPSPDGITHYVGVCGTSFNAPTTCTSGAGQNIGVSSTDPVVIQPLAINGYSFSGWTGCQSVNGTNCSIFVAGGQTASITANYAPNNPAHLTINVNGPAYSAVAFSASQKEIGYCYGAMQAWQWPTGSSTCVSGADASGTYFPIGSTSTPTTLTAPATVVDPQNRTYNFTGWSGSTSAGSCSGTGGCVVYVPQGQTNTITANYTLASPSTLTIAVSGYSGTVTFNTYQHTVGNCDSTIPGTINVSAANNYGTVQCASGQGYGIGSPSGLYISPVVPAGYAFSGWSFSGSSGASATCTNTSGTALTSSTQCVNLPPGGVTATITATFTINQPATLTVNTTGVYYTSLAFSATPHDVGYCYGATQGWQWPAGSNTCTSGLNATGQYYGIGPTTLTAPSTYTDSSNQQWVFTGWSGYCSGVGGCTVSLNPGQGASVTANYQLANSSTIYIYVSGASGSVPFTTSNHTLGYCNPSYQTFYVTGGSYITCTSGAGYGLGYPEGLNLIAPSTTYDGANQYNFSSWSGGGYTGSGCTYASNALCINIPPGGYSTTVTANFVYIPPAPTCNVSGSYPEELCINISGGAYYNSWAYSTQHSVGTCVTSTNTWFSIPANCNGFSFGYPDGFYLYANNPNGVSNFSYWSVDKYPSTGSISCYSTYCFVNYGPNAYDTAIITAHYY